MDENQGISPTTETLEHTKITYTLKPAQATTTFTAIIGGDWNDGDDIEKPVVYSAEQFNDKIAMALYTMNRFSRYCDQDNTVVVQSLFPDLNEEQAEEIGEIVNDMLPWGIPDSSEFHTVWCREILCAKPDGTTLKVEIDLN